ncbi:MAG: methanogenesis marker 3 protein [Candidatus Nezhaarchaeota archaeon]|nr:methanogenesis marker 3 protein [Candidatus Nezhaarchaeota archaeon]
MEEIVDVIVDGKPLKCRRGLSVGELLGKLGVDCGECLVVGLSAAKEELLSEIRSYAFETPRGTFILEVDEDCVKLWRDLLNNVKLIGVKWATRRDVGLGTFSAPIIPEVKSREWKPWDVLISAEGLQADNIHVVVLKTSQVATYAPPRGMERLGRISKGKGIILKLQAGDPILSITPVIASQHLRKVAVKLSPSDRISEPMEVLTTVRVKLLDAAPAGSEHLLSIAELSGVRVAAAHSTFIRVDELRGLPLPLENKSRRVRGAVTVKVDGNHRGSVYLYKETSPSSYHHSVVGYVEGGMEIVDLASYGDKVRIETEPKRVNLLGLTQLEASETLKSMGIRHERAGSSNNDDIVVEQEPEITFHVLRRGEAKTYGLPSKLILKVKLFSDLAPRTTWYFKALTGLLKNKVGKLRVYMADPLVGFVLFEGSKENLGLLLPENAPREKVEPLTLGVTNSSKKFVGLVGVRLTGSDRYGPTGEDFEGTNIVGKVVNGIEALKGVREGSTVYLMEV